MAGHIFLFLCSPPAIKPQLTLSPTRATTNSAVLYYTLTLERLLTCPYNLLMPRHTSRVTSGWPQVHGLVLTPTVVAALIPLF